MTAFHRSAEWARLTRRLRPVFAAQVAAGTAVCVDCGGPILPGERWECGHRLARVTHPQLALAEHNIGPSHRSCNGRDGARLGNRIAAANRARRRDMFDWRRA